MTLHRRPRTRLAAFAVLVLVPLALWVGLPGPTPAAPTSSELESRVQSSKDTESGLESQAARLGALADRLAAQVGILQRRRAEVESELASRRTEQRRARTQLRRERARLKRLRARLGFSRRVLSRRLVEVYKSGKPDLITVVLTSKGFADLLERREFLRRIDAQDRRIIISVRTARDAARRETVRLAALERRARVAADAVAKKLGSLQQLESALAAKQATLQRAREARLAALRSTRADRRKLEQDLEALRQEQQQSQATSGSFGNWVIPWPIVQCESGGFNHPPNYAGASGYYQIIPSTWSGFGGKGPAAWLASKAEQDRVASLIWNGGAGAGNWVCAGLVSY